MKNKIFIIVLSLLFILPSFAQLDRSKRPQPGPAPEIKLAEYQSFSLDNGLKVFIVENHKLPVVDFRLVLDRDPVYEGSKAGYISIAGDLLRTGTNKRTKDQIDEEVDFLGASLSTGPTSIFGSSLKKNSEKLFDIFSDIILNYNFKQEELDKLKKQYISGIMSNKDDPNTIAGTVQNALVYGKNHPYGETTTEETVDSVTLDMCKNYVDTYFKPNIAYLAIVGDITKAEAEKLVKKYLGTWKKGEVPKHQYDDPKAPDKINVALVDRPASVQSVIHVTYPIHLKLGDEDYIPAKLMNTIFGGSSSARLYLNLRENKGYTYGAYSSLETDRLVGNFDASLQARNSVTDSSVREIFGEMRNYKKTGTTEEELTATKNYVTGSFARSLESPQTIASFAINTAIYKLPENYYAAYLQKVAAVKVEDVNKAIEKYIKPEQAYVVVVGNASEVEKGLTRWGEINYYDIYGNKINPAMLALPAGLEAPAVIEKYINAIGGKDNLAKVKDRTTVMSGKLQGFDVSMTMYQKDPDKLKEDISAMGMKQVILFDGVKGAMKVGEKKIDITGTELTKLQNEATLGLLLELDKHNIKLNLAGAEKINDKLAYKVEMIFPDSTKWIQYYDPDSGLKLKEYKTITSPQGTFTQETSYEDYREVEGVKYPFVIKQAMGPQKIDFTVTSIKVNTGLSDDIFKLE